MLYFFWGLRARNSILDNYSRKKQHRKKLHENMKEIYCLRLRNENMKIICWISQILYMSRELVLTANWLERLVQVWGVTGQTLAPSLSLHSFNYLPSRPESKPAHQLLKNRILFLVWVGGWVGVFGCSQREPDEFNPGGAMRGWWGVFSLVWHTKISPSINHPLIIETKYIILLVGPHWMTDIKGDKLWRKDGSWFDIY